MFKTVAVSTLAAAASAQVFMTPLVQNTPFLQESWPGVNAFLNFKADLSAHTENEFKFLIPYMGMTLTENVWSDGNQERLDIKMNIPNLGYGDIIEYLDFTSQVMTVYIPSIKNCQKYAMPFKLDIKDMFLKIADPTSGILDFEGEKTLDFAEGESFYAFHMNMQSESVAAGDQTLYFNTVSKQLEYSVLNELDVIIYSENGPQPAEFTAADFVLPAECAGVEVNPVFPSMFRQE
jgi:hypothetical protein